MVFGAGGFGRREQDEPCIILERKNFLLTLSLSLIMVGYNPYFLGLEILVFLLFGLCLRHAWRQGALNVWQLAAGVIYGLLLEWATIQQLQAYRYGQFHFMIGELPLAVGVAWGTIIYSVHLFSEASNLPLWLRPACRHSAAGSASTAWGRLSISYSSSHAMHLAQPWRTSVNSPPHSGQGCARGCFHTAKLHDSGSSFL